MHVIVGEVVTHRVNQNDYRIVGVVSAPMKHRKDGEHNFLTAHFLDTKEKGSARRFLHLLDNKWIDERVSLRLEVILQISGDYRHDETLDWVIYESMETLVLFARPRREFEDGRFVYRGNVTPPEKHKKATPAGAADA